MTHLEFATDLARQAGTIIHRNFHLGMRKEWKADGTPLTAADTEVNALVLDAVAEAFPDYAVLAEEGSRPIAGARWVWVCDPVDGTIPFSHGVPTAVFALALVDTTDGQPVLGVIYDPFLDRMFVAERGHGATVNGSPTHVSVAGRLAGTTIGYAAWRQMPYRLPGLYDALLEHRAGVMNVVSVVYMGLLVASGELSATVFPARHPWDGAALKVLIDEAGGTMTDLFGAEQRYDQPTRGFIASNGLVHDELVTLLRDNLSQK